MRSTCLKAIVIGGVLACGAGQAAHAQLMLKIPLPAHSRLTPVQRLNREGVTAVEKKDYSRASQLFYRAYLYDPADPFTLNNLGYISELQGHLNRADKFYKLASEQGSNADIDMSNLKGLKGKPMKVAFENLTEKPMQVNRMNVDAMTLLAQGRNLQAIELLQHALTIEPDDAFTLNNLGAADEAMGNYPQALKYYQQAANSPSSAVVVVTAKSAWSGKPVTAVARANIARLRKEMKGVNSSVVQAALYNRLGVFASNENNQAAARNDFLRAYALDPSNAFSLNNRGYVAEMDGDLESAQYFYQKAQQSGGADTRVGLATNHAAQGQPLSQVASGSTGKVDGALAIYTRNHLSQPGTIELTPRGGSRLQPPSAKKPPPQSRNGGSHK